MKRTPLLLAALCGLLATGCQSVPMTKISMPSPKGVFTMEFPKDMAWTNVNFKVTPDGSVDVKIGGVTSHNDAAVLGVIAGANAKMAADFLDFAKEALAAGKTGGAAFPSPTR